MPIFLTLLNNVAETYLQSLKKDLAKNDFGSALLIASISWGGLVILAVLFLLGDFHMPHDPAFYLLWFAMALLTSIKFAFFVIGLKNTNFLAANTLPNVAFVTTVIYAALFLREPLSALQLVAVIVAVIGTSLFFSWKGFSKIITANKGFLFILFSLFIAPFGSIFYKAAVLHTNSYAQFLTGRLVMDFAYYTLFFLVVFVFWYRKNPISQSFLLSSSFAGFAYIVGWTLTNLLDSWLIFLLPISLFTMLGTVSIPASYVIGKIKYKEKIKTKDAVGAVLIVGAVLLFLS